MNSAKSEVNIFGSKSDPAIGYTHIGLGFVVFANLTTHLEKARDFDSFLSELSLIC